MKIWGLLGLVSLMGLAGCELLEYFPENKTVIDPAAEAEGAKLQEAVTDTDEDQLQPQRSVTEWLSQRHAICTGLETATEAMVPVATISSDQSIEDQLDVLLVSSCRPASTPGILSEALHSLSRAGSWPEEYLALFDMLNSSQKAYSSVEKLYRELKMEHEKTIQGLSEIEDDIEAQSIPAATQGLLP